MEKINSGNFEAEVLKSEKPVLLEFYSDSCVPCRMLSPVLAELEEQQNGIKIAKINTQFSLDITKFYGIEATPTLILFKGGKEIKRLKGFVKKADLEKTVEEISV